jgi:hypothetical protein
MGLPQWQGWAAVHSANGFKDYSGALSTVYVSCCDNKNVGRPNILDLATQPESLGNAGGSGQNCVSQADKTFCESLRNVGTSDQLDDRDSDQISQTQSAVTSPEFFVATDMATDTAMDKNTDGRPNIVDLATHMAKYQPVLTIDRAAG